MKKFVAALILSSLIGASPVNAEVVNYEGVGEYVMSDFETPDVAKQRAKLYAERNAQEKAGVYIKSYSKMSNFELVTDEVESMTAGILKVVSVDYKIIPMEEYAGIMYRATIQASIDTDNVDSWISRGVDERESLVQKNIDLQRQLDEQQRLIEQLKAKAKNSPSNRERLQQDFKEADRIFMSNIKLEEGNRWVLLNSDWAYEQALNNWNEAIDLNPNNAQAYEARGYYYLYYTLNYTDSLSDYNQAIKLRPSVADNYLYRGTCYLNMDDLDKAKRDFERALALNPQMSAPLGELAYIYATSGQPNKAIEFANRAIALDNRNWRALYSRGLAFFTMHDYETALADGQEALRWGCGDAYQLIGDCYGMLGLPDEAQKYWELAKIRPAFG